MKTTEYLHKESCPCYLRSLDTSLCECEKYWDIRGLEKIQTYLEIMFAHNPEPDLFTWANIVNGFEDEENDGGVYEYDEE